jgi:hypothetical protein
LASIKKKEKKIEHNEQHSTPFNATSGNKQQQNATILSRL